MDTLSQYDKDFIEQYGIEIFNQNTFCSDVAKQIRFNENKVIRTNNCIPMPPIEDMPIIRKGT